MAGTVLKIAGFTFLLLLCHLGSLRGLHSYTAYVRPNTEQWNKSTPNLESNLLNWKSGNCKKDETICPCYNPNANWRGVTCIRFENAAKCTGKCTHRWDTWMVGLELNDASIEGALPPRALRNISRALVTLSLTGNPKLTGPLDGLNKLYGRPLNTLDLHDNGFTGAFPTGLSSVDTLLKLDLSGNQLEGEFPIELMNMTTLQEFRIARNKLHGNISPDAFYALLQLFVVDLSGNNFTGSPPNFSTQTKLNYLNLSYNPFTGLPILSEVFKTWLPKRYQSLRVLDLSGLNVGERLPDLNSSPDLLSLEQLGLNNNGLVGELNISSIKSRPANLTGTSNRTLRMLSLMNNDITNVIFDKTTLTDGQIKIYLQGNPYCNDTSKNPDGRRCFCEQYCAISPEIPSKSYSTVIAVSTAICGSLLGSVILSLACILKRKNKDMYALLKKFEESEVSAKRFEYNVLRTATKNFADERKLGQGAFGAVYKGILPNEVEIAVKRFLMKTKEASEDFLNEILLITNLQHRNLVALKGFSLHGQEMLLVYDYVDYCDLDKLLFHSSTTGQHTWEVVSWPARMNICLGVAQGLYYLHASSQTRVSHRDIKASNILLDKNLNPKIADFGLARPMQDAKSETMTRPAGTIGYLAPEYVLYGQLNEKADVYSFGVLLLEIVSRNRKKDPTKPEDDIYLPTLACKLHREERLMEVMDPKLEVSEDKAMEVRRVLETAIMCVQSYPEQRPTMFRVVAMLAGDSDLVSGPIDVPMIPWPESQSDLYKGSGPEDCLLAPSSSRRSAKPTQRSDSIELSSIYEISQLGGDNT